MSRIFEAWSPRNPDGSIRWSWSVVENYLTCPRKFEIAVVQNLVAKEYAQARETGSALHRGMAVANLKLKDAQEKHGGPFAVDENWIEYLLDTAVGVIQSDPNVREEDRAEAIRLITAYIRGDEYGAGGPRHFSRWRILAVEHTQTADLSALLPPAERSCAIPWGQTADLVVEVAEKGDIAAGVYCADYKTARSAGPRIKKYSRDGQALACIAVHRAASAAGCMGFIPVIIVKTKTVQLFSEPVYYPGDGVLQFVRSLSRWQQEIMALVRFGAADWPMNYSACIGQYGYCDYYAKCHEGSDDFVPRDSLTPGQLVEKWDGPFEIDWSVK